VKRQSFDIAELVRGKWLNDLNFIKRLIRSWGTTTVNGQEVLVNRRYFYPTSHQNESFIRFAKLIKAYSDLQNPQMKGVVNAWLYFNPSKFSNDEILDDVIASNLRTTLWEEGGVLNEGETLRTSVVIGNPLSSGNSKLSYLRTLVDNFDSPTLVAGIDSEEELIQEIKDTYSTIWDTYTIDSGTSFEALDESGRVVADISPNDDWIQTLSRYILFSEDISYDVIKVRNGTKQLKIPLYRNNEVGEPEVYGYKTKVISTIVIDIEIPLFFLNENTDIVTKITDDLNNTSGGNDRLTKQTLYGSDYSEPETATDVRVVQNTRKLVDVSGLEGLTWERSGENYYIRTSYLLDSSIPASERLNTVLGCLDTGYKKKKAKWYQRILAIVIFIIAVVVTYYAGVQAGMHVYTALAGAIVMGSLVLSVVAAIAYQTGNYGLADAATSLNKTIEPLVFVAQIVSLYYAFASVAKEGAKSMVSTSTKAAAEAAAREGATELAKELIENEITAILKDQFAEALMEGIKGRLTDILSIRATDISLNHIVKMTDMVFGLYSKNDISKRQERIQNLQDEYNEMQEEMAEANAQNDLIAVMSSLIYRPLAVDKSVYAQQFDLPYEHTGTRFHIGNICKTSVKALRLTV
jgi:hypothetical protein